MSQADRAQTMALKLAAYSERAGVSPALVVAAYEHSVSLRLEQLGDVFHPDLLHPARVALILLEDAHVRAAELLAAASLIDTEYLQLQLPAARIAAAFGTRVAGLVEAVPRPSAALDRLLEELVSLPEDVAIIALAERLDHARHLHFRDPSIWPIFHGQIMDCYLPFARRIHEVLAVRLERWAHAFAERRL